MPRALSAAPRTLSPIVLRRAAARMAPDPPDSGSDSDSDCDQSTCPCAWRATVAERTRICRELHDRIGQSIGIAYRNLELHEIAAGNGAAVDERLTTATAFLRQAMAQLQAVISDLRMPEEGCGGFEAALRRYLDSMAHQPIEVSLTVCGDEQQVPPAVLDQAYLVVREALHNAFKHARARHIAARVQLGPAAVVASVVDDGAGFDPERSCGDSGVGLASVRARVREAGGSLRILGSSTGTRVEFALPVGAGAGR